MTWRERLATVLAGGVPDRIPMVARLDIWHTARTSDGTLPDEVGGLTVPEIELKLGMGVSARFAGFCRPVFEGATRRQRVEGRRTITELAVGGHTLKQVETQYEQQKRLGVKGQIDEHLLKTEDDYRAYADAWRSVRWEVDHAAFDAYDAGIGDDGLPMIITGVIPAHRIMMLEAGYNSVFFHMADFPDAFEELLRTMVAAHVKLWTELASSGAAMILHGAHHSSQMTPPPIYERYFVPYLKRFADAMHAVGKKVVFHADADLSELLDFVPQAGLDVADCFACAPLVPLSLHDARAAWAEDVVIWGGIPSIILEPSFPQDEFRRYLDGFFGEIADGRAIIIGVSDNIMPAALYERIAEVARRAAETHPG